MSLAEDLLAANRRYAAGFATDDLGPAPRRELAVVACMDARMDVHALLGLAIGEAHVIRNAGALITDDVIRSLLISQRLLGTRHIVVVGHTDCGMRTVDDEALADAVEADSGTRPAFALGGFTDVDVAVTTSVERLRAEPLVPTRDDVCGFVFDVTDGRLRHVA